ncbi:hypothetical protein [Dyella sp. 2RAB6]|uniref:hypothetical protein n=1 Tax=Dyella sp. 2RAB6 TaxID=3232992 RepID=UPI003F936A3E
MAFKNSRRVSLGALLGAPVAALQWRLLLLWTLLLLLPTLVAALPLLRTLSLLLDHSVHADAWAHQFDALMFGDTVRSVMNNGGAVHGGLIAGVLLTVLLSPLLNGMAVGAGRAGRSLGFGHLLQSGVVEYGRMFRLMLWTVLPYAAALWAVKGSMDLLDDKTEVAVLEAQAQATTHWILALAVLCVVLAQVIADAGRAAFIADLGLRSASKAIWRGFLQLLRRPFSSLFAYVFVSAIGFGVAFVLGVARAHVTSVGLGLVLGFLLMQVVVMVMGWTRVARLFALAEVARSLGGGRRAAF